MTETLRPRFNRGKTTIEVPVNGEYARFIFSEKRPESYESSFQKLAEEGLVPATGEQLAELLYLSHLNPERPEKMMVRHIMEQQGIRLPYLNLWTPEGVYVVYHKEPAIENLELDPNQLELILKDAECIGGVRFSRDGKVRFAPKDTYYDRYDKQTSKHQDVATTYYYGDNDRFPSERELQTIKFGVNGFLRATFGCKGAKKLATIIHFPTLTTIDTNEKSIIALSSLGCEMGYTANCSLHDFFLGDTPIPYVINSKNPEHVFGVEE